MTLTFLKFFLVDVVTILRGSETYSDGLDLRAAVSGQACEAGHAVRCTSTAISSEAPMIRLLAKMAAGSQSTSDRSW